MKVLSIRQPWASLIVGCSYDLTALPGVFSGLKTVENRSWYTSYRGRFLVHASKVPDMSLSVNLPLGHIVGCVEIFDCVRNAKSPWAIEGQWHWLLRKSVAFVKPFPYRGAQGWHTLHVSKITHTQCASTCCK